MLTINPDGTRQRKQDVCVLLTLAEMKTNESLIHAEHLENSARMRLIQSTCMDCVCRMMCVVW